MISVDERKEILRLYLKREEKEERRQAFLRRLEADEMTHEDGRRLVQVECNDIALKRQVLSSIRLNTLDWYQILYDEGFLCPLYTPANIIRQGALERKTSLKRRYETWKRLRPYLQTKGLTEDMRMFPAYQKCIFQFLSKDPARLAWSCNLFVQMIINYIPLYNMYMYNPLYGKHMGYKYYSGEPLILYYITEKAKDARIWSRLKNAIYQEYANGYCLKNCYKVILCNFDWRVLDSQKGTGEFKLFVINSDFHDDIADQCMCYWKDHTADVALFSKYDVFDYAATEKTLPWPFYLKERNLERLEFTKAPNS